MTTIDPNMDIDSAVPKESNYLTKDDVGLTGKNLTIASFTRENVAPQGEEIKTVIHWTSSDKPLIVNQTNKNRLKSICKGTKVADFIGQTVNVYNDPYVEFGGNVTGGIRIRERVGDQAPQPAVMPPQPPDMSGNDIPF
jgi:hypothetical protein